MRTMWTILAAIAFLIVVPVSISYYNDYIVFKRGHIVKATITSVPNSLFNVTSQFIKFEFNGEIYDKKVYNPGNYHIGDTIELRYLEGHENNFLLANENPQLVLVCNEDGSK